MPDAPDPTGAARPGGFDGVAGRVAARVMARLNADMERAALDALDPRPGDRVLVVGFGPGVGVTELLRRVPDRVERDAATAGFSAPAWSAGRYRSGAATQLVRTAAPPVEG
jgi:hypothetical protein